MAPTFDPKSIAAGPARAASKGSTTFVFGLVLSVLGILALIFADVVTVASVLIFGVLLVLGGISEIAYAFRNREGGRFLLPFLSGLLSLAVGALLVFRPAAGVAGSALLIAGWLFATGLFRGVTSLMDRYRYWGWDLTYGIISVLLGFWVAATLPRTAVWLLGTVVAIELFARGLAVMSVSLAFRRIARAEASSGA